MNNKWQHQKYSANPTALLREMSIPGTHDSCARYNRALSYTDKCQEWSVTEQLNNGIRFLDLRLNYNNDDNRDENGFTGFDIYHGRFQNATFKPSWYGVIDPDRSDVANIYAEMVQWIIANPTEFVLVNIANTGGTASDEFTAEFWKTIISLSKGVDTPDAHLWYLFNPDAATKDDLIYENLQGKFVLIRSDPDWTWSRSGSSLGLPCDAYKINGLSTTPAEPYFRSQNYWKEVTRSAKQNYIAELFDEIKNAPLGQQYMYFNWISLGFGLSDGGLHGPEYFANLLNPFLSACIEDMVKGGAISSVQLRYLSYLGVVIMDFPTVPLIQQIIDYPQ